MSATQDAAQYGLSPFQRISIPLMQVGAVTNRTLGEVFSQYEGNSLYIERVDLPVLISFVDANTGTKQTHLAVPGLEITANFKKLTITHEAVPAGVVPLALEFTIGKFCARRTNGVSNPYMGYYPPFQVVTDNAIGGELRVRVPPGARYLNRIEIFMTATTLTVGKFGLFTADGVAIGMPATGVFTTPGVSVFYGDTAILNTTGRIRADDIVLPAAIGDGGYIDVLTLGTGLSLVGASVKASFQ